MNKKFLKVTSAALVATLTVGALAPTTKAFADTSKTPVVSQTAEYGGISVEDIKPVEEITEQDLIDLQAEFEAAGLTDEDISELFLEALPNLNNSSSTNPVPSSEPTFGIMGLKGKSASVAAKQMIKEMKEVGKTEFNKAMKKVVEKLPLSKKAKVTVLSYVSYQSVMGVLNIVVDFNGNATEGLKKGFKKYLGMNDFFAGMCARAITMVLL